MPSLNLSHRLMDVAYPELRERDTHVSVTLEAPFNRDWTTAHMLGIVVSPADFKSPQNVASDTFDDYYLRGSIELNGTRIESIDLSGMRTNARQIRELTARAQSHPEWTDSDIAQALNRIGAKYGPDKREKFVQETPIEQLAAILGRVEKRDVTFRWRQGAPELGSHDILSPTWMAQLELRDEAGERLCYTMFFEPIGGSFRALFRRSCK
jgi:hypothetical protein